MAQLVLDNVSKTYRPRGKEPVQAVKRVSLDVKDGEIVALLGSSGCGKTSMLRMIAGFEEVTEGAIRIGGKEIHNLPPVHRDVAMAFEGYSLYPPLKVRENIGFALLRERGASADIEKRVRHIAELLEISDILERYPTVISAGEGTKFAEVVNDFAKKLKALVRDGIGSMVGDVLGESRRRIAEAGVGTVDEVRAAGRPLVGFSEAMQTEERALKRHLYAQLYDSDALRPIRIEAQRIIGDLAQYYREDPSALPDGWQRGEGETARLRGIGDYIAGMTDRFAIARHEELIGTVNLPDRF